MAAFELDRNIKKSFRIKKIHLGLGILCNSRASAEGIGPISSSC
jgi:hypothetical protein